MSELVPINLSAIESKHAKQEAKQILAQQVSSKDRLEEALSQRFNPEAVEREQARQEKFKTLDHRKEKAQKAKEEPRVEEVDQRSEEDLAHGYQRRNYELPYDRLLALMRGLKQNANANEILHQVLEEFEDVSLADEALEYLTLTTDGDLKEAIKKAKEELNKANEQQIRAGKNIDKVAKQFNRGGLGESPTELRDLYRDITGNPRDHNTLFSELAKKYSYDELAKVVSFLLKSLGFDFKSKGPSIAQAELMRLMSDCRNLQSILWIYLFFKYRMKMIKKMLTQKGFKSSKSLTFETLAKEFMKLVEERYPSVLKLLKQADHLKLTDPAKIVILTQYRDAIRGLSPRLYKSLKHRQDLLLVIIEALEELEEEEEEYA
ncbi:MAG: type III secretion system gatekeeper subunit SctW [Chlamydiia bacterium]|nr:type III secretion system gatekeeper subunit SctW [Chlamydiia bacterium]